MKGKITHESDGAERSPSKANNKEGREMSRVTTLAPRRALSVHHVASASPSLRISFHWCSQLSEEVTNNDSGAFRFFCLVLLSSTFLFVSLPTHHPPRQHSIVQIKVLFIWVVSRRQDSKCGNHPNTVNYISYNSRVIIPLSLSVETVLQRGVLSEKDW